MARPVPLSLSAEGVAVAVRRSAESNWMAAGHAAPRMLRAALSWMGSEAVSEGRCGTGWRRVHAKRGWKLQAIGWRSKRVVRSPSACVDDVASCGYLELMRSVGIRVLKNKLSEYLHLVASGETVLVTDRDRVVAELVPPREGRSPLLSDALLAEAVRKGWLTPHLLPRDEPPPRLPVARWDALKQELADDRGER